MSEVVVNDAIDVLKEAFYKFSINERFDDNLKNRIASNLDYYNKLPIGLLSSELEKFLNSNIFNVSFNDLEESGLYDIFYKIVLLNFEGVSNGKAYI